MLRQGCRTLRPPRATAAVLRERRRAVDDMAVSRRTRRGKNLGGRAVGEGACAGAAALRGAAGRAHRAGRRDRARCARGDGRRRVGRARRACAPRAPGLDAEPAAHRMEQRRDRAGVLGGRSGKFARPAIRRRLGRRTREVAARRRRLRHAAVCAAPRGAAAPGHHHDAAAERADQAPAHRSAYRGHPRADAGQRLQSRAGLSRNDRRPLCRHPARPPGTRRRDRRGPAGRAVVARADRGGARRRSAAPGAHRGRRRSAGLERTAGGRLRHRRRRPRRRL